MDIYVARIYRRGVKEREELREHAAMFPTKEAASVYALRTKLNLEETSYFTHEYEIEHTGLQIILSHQV